ncbi:hypothetical protein KUTeg_018385 [Tegillarca granosa]|uniref:Uncharacterized protein n=1 Tax=Tegillarca granosa TaxID=220873 RepID=A0ABQ9ELL2_TEGGR|nr:hypothetical protein KUTeg_018385 [Tegillarca granosa]
MEADEILQHMGGYGRFQGLVFLGLCFIYMRGAWPVMAILFLGGDPGHHCKIPVNSTLNQSIPGKMVDGVWTYDKCKIYVPESGHNETQSCTSWSYGDEFKSTILSEWNLVCDKDYLVDTSTTVYMVGNAVGAVTLTSLSDRFGRKHVMLLMLWIQGVIGFGAAYANSYILFTVLRFFIALLNMLPSNLFVVDNADSSAEHQSPTDQPGISQDGLIGGPVAIVTQKKNYTVLDLFKTPTIRKYAIIMFYIWLANSLSYFGILFATPTLHGNQFLNLGISGAVEIPALFICMFALETVGRKKPLIVFFFLCGIMNIATIFVPTTTESGVNLTPLIITLAMLGKFGITGSYSVSYLYSSEIFPTPVRNHALGLASFFENTGGIVAPFIVYGASKSTQYLPLVVFGTLTLIAGILTFFLPETHQRPLPETIEEVENLKYTTPQTSNKPESTHL